MSAALLALLASGGGSVWVYNKLMRHTGAGNSRDAVIAASAVFVVGFIVIFSLAHIFLGGSNN